MLEAMIPFQAPKGASEIAFTLGGGIPLIFGNLQRMDRANQILILALLASFVVICINGTQSIDWTALTECSWDNTLGAIPAAFVTLVRSIIERKKETVKSRAARSLTYSFTRSVSCGFFFRGGGETAARFSTTSFLSYAPTSIMTARASKNPSF